MTRWMKLALTCALALALGTGCEGSSDDAGAQGPTSTTTATGGDGDGDGDGGAGDPAGDTTGGDGDGDGDGFPDEPPDDETGGDGDGDEEPACNDEDSVRLFLSPDDSNSMSSPVQMRGAIEEYQAPYAPIRPWEFFNYYSFDYPPADPGLVTLTSELVPDDGISGRYTLQIGVASEEIASADRAPMNLTFVLDTSGSMSGHPIEMLRTVCREIAAKLKAGDIVSMVTWDTEQRVILANHEVSGPNDAELVEAIADIRAGGGTDLNAGLVKGYELANNSFSTSRTNRVLLISDGGANAGITDVELIAQNAGGRGEDGIYMVGVGVGTGGSYNDDLMDSVTDAGKGASVFIDSASEARRMFFQNFVNTMSIAVRDVQVQLDLPAGFELVTFSGEEVSTDPTEIEPQHLAFNDAMVFHQEIETCAPELVEESTELSVTVRYRDAVTFEPRELTQTYTFGELAQNASPRVLKGVAVMRYTEALAAVKENPSGEAAEAAMGAARTALEAADEANPADSDIGEMTRMLGILSE